MKRIKYLGVLLSIVTLCVACEKSEKDGLGGFHKNFVELYVDGQIMLTEFQNECSGDAHRSVSYTHLTLPTILRV